MKLANGLLVISAGRPGVFVWVAHDPPTEWTGFNITEHHNRAYPNRSLHYSWPIHTSSYTGMVAVPDQNEVIVSYDMLNTPGTGGAVFAVRVHIDRAAPPS